MTKLPGFGTSTGASAAKSGDSKSTSKSKSNVLSSEKKNMKSMKHVEKKMKKEVKKGMKAHKSSSSNEVSSPSRYIEPQRFHRDMRLICDVFRISDPSRYALRTFDAASLEDFVLMTDEDFADMIVTQARNGHPLPPLQQRKLRVLLSWVQSLATTDNLDWAASTPNKTEGFELKESPTDENGEDGIKASYKASPRKEGGTFIPKDWEKRFYADLPRLKKELHQMGKETSGHSPSNWVSGFLSLKWMFCG